MFGAVDANVDVAAWIAGVHACDIIVGDVNG